MKNVIVVLCMLLGISMFACATSDTTDVGQSICQDDPDTCPGGHPLTPRQLAELEISSSAQSYPGQTPISKNTGACDSHVCTVKWDFGSWYLITSCNACNCYTDACQAESTCMHTVPGPNCMR